MDDEGWKEDKTPFHFDRGSCVLIKCHEGLVVIYHVP